MTPRPIVSTLAYYVGAAWFAAVAAIDRILAHAPWRMP